MGNTSTPIIMRLQEYNQHVADNDGLCLKCLQWTSVVLSHWTERIVSVSCAVITL
jgi:hypothetical protein